MVKEKIKLSIAVDESIKIVSGKLKRSDIPADIRGGIKVYSNIKNIPAKQGHR